MVKYYGRARQRIGSVNTNQIGLKMSGCPAKVGRKGTINRYISRRSQCNQKYCGPVYYHGVIWNWNGGQCVAKAPRGQSFNSGVGTKVGNPRFACNKTCSTNLDPLTAVKILQGYLKYKYGDAGSLILVAPKETLESDGVLCDICGEIKHFDPSHPEYYTLPANVRAAANAINNLGISWPLKKGGPSVPHVVGYETYAGQIALRQKGFGVPLQFGPQTLVDAYGACDTGMAIFTVASLGLVPLGIMAYTTAACASICQSAAGCPEYYNDETRCYNYNIQCSPGS